MGAGAAAVTALRTADASASPLLPCINQVTTLGAAFDAECSAYHDAGFRHVELWFPKLKQLGLAPPAIAARLREAALTPVSACAAGNLLWRGAPGPVERRGELEAHFALAEALGVPRFVIFDYVEATPPRDDHAVAAERLVALAEIAARHRVRIALEFIARSRLLGSLRTALQVIRRAAQGNVGLCLDTFHFYAGVSKLEDLDELRPGEVEHVHFHDVPGAVPRERGPDPARHGRHSPEEGGGCAEADRLRGRAQRGAVRSRGPEERPEPDRADLLCRGDPIHLGALTPPGIGPTMNQ